MEDLKEFITSQKAEDPNIVVDPIDLKFGQRKRMAVEEPIEEPASKKEKFSTTGRSLVDQLKCEFSYAKFEEIFEKFDMVQLKSQDYTTDELDTPSALKIIFDLHLHNKGFKKSAPNAPNFNVIILPSQVAFPTHDKISKIKHQNLLTAPLLVISVSESKQIQAFLYYISWWLPIQRMCHLNKLYVLVF